VDSGQNRRRIARSQWQEDILRHTWISARLATTQDEAKTALEAGTSIGMIHAHYHSLTTRQAAAALWSIRPQKHPTP
jgi:hypothetical protein